MRNLRKLKRIKILGKPFKVFFYKEKTGRLHDEEEGKDYIGRICYTEQWMAVCQDIGLEETFDTILHEAAHAVEYILGYDSKEKYIRGMMSGLAAVLLDNFNITPKKETL